MEVPSEAVCHCGMRNLGRFGSFHGSNISTRPWIRPDLQSLAVRLPKRRARAVIKLAKWLSDGAHW